MGMDGCGLPILVHGDLKIYQSFACQNYLASTGPKYPKVTAQQQAVDDMFQGALEDCMGLGAGVILSGGDPALGDCEHERECARSSDTAIDLVAEAGAALSVPP